MSLNRHPFTGQLVGVHINHKARPAWLVSSVPGRTIAVRMWKRAWAMEMEAWEASRGNRSMS